MHRRPRTRPAGPPAVEAGRPEGLCRRSCRGRPPWPPCSCRPWSWPLGPPAGRSSPSTGCAGRGPTEAGAVRWPAPATGSRSSRASPSPPPPAGDAALALPQPAAPWTGTRDATELRQRACPQAARHGAAPTAQRPTRTACSSASPPPRCRRPSAASCRSSSGSTAAPSSAAPSALYPTRPPGHARAMPSSSRSTTGSACFGFMAAPGLQRRAPDGGLRRCEDQRQALRWVAAQHRRPSAANPSNVHARRRIRRRGLGLHAVDRADMTRAPACSTRPSSQAGRLRPSTLRTVAEAQPATGAAARPGRRAAASRRPRSPACGPSRRRTCWTPRRTRWPADDIDGLSRRPSGPGAVPRQGARRSPPADFVRRADDQRRQRATSCGSMSPTPSRPARTRHCSRTTPTMLQPIYGAEPAEQVLQKLSGGGSIPRPRRRWAR